MKVEYETPELEVIDLEKECVVVTSGCNTQFIQCEEEYELPFVPI